MMEYVRDGDTLYIESISRLERSTKDLLNIVEQLKIKGVELVSLKENIDTKTPQGKFMLTVFGALAELERENTLQRQNRAVQTVDKLTNPLEKTVAFDELSSSYGVVRRFLPKFLLVTNLKATSAAQSVLNAWNFLKNNEFKIS